MHLVKAARDDRVRRGETVEALCGTRGSVEVFSPLNLWQFPNKPVTFTPAGKNADYSCCASPLPRGLVYGPGWPNDPRV